MRRTVPVTITTPLYFDSSFANSNLATSISRIQIGAMSPDNYVNIGGDTMTGSLDMSGNTYTTYGPNTSWGAYLRVGGNGRTVNGDSYASVVATDGNLHLDAGNAKAMYLNYYAGTGGIIFGNGATGTNANVSAAGAYTGTSLNVGSGAITSGLINGQTISSAANFTGSLTVAGETYLNGTVLEGDNKTMFRYSDSYLRLNEDNDFSNGIWFGPSNRLGGAGYMALGSNGGTTNSTLYLYGGDYTGTNLIKIDSSSGTATSYFNAGNVGIGTTAPQGQIQVKGADDVMTTSQDTPGGGTYMGGGNGCPWCGQWYTSYSPIPGAGVGDGGSSGGKAAGVYYGGYGDWVAGGGAGIYTQGGAGSLHGFGGVGIYAKGGVHGANVGNGVAPAIYADGPMVTSGGLVVGSAYATSARNANSSYGMAVADGNAYISGSVGIGTTNPLAPLMVGSGASGNNRLSGGSYSEYWITESYPRVFLSRDGGGSGVSALQFGIGSSPVDTTIQRLPSGAGLALMGGNVGIGTTNPQAKLEIAGSTSTNYPIYGKGDTGAKVFYNVANYNYDGGNQTGYAIIQTNIPQDDHTMISVDVDVYGLYYDGSSNNCRLVISGYWSSESNGGFMGLGQTNVCGTKYNVQMARNTGTGKAAIIIGSVGTTWSHPKIYVPKMEAGYGIADSYADSWSIQVTTDISGFSNNDNVPDTTSVAAASSVAYANITGLPTRTAWSGVHRGFVAEQLSWKNYGNSHTIFDASQSTSPDGGAVNNTNAQVPWSATYPTLMGWNGGATYGVRVDSARVSDYSSSTNDIFVNTTGDTMSGNLTFDNYGIGVVGTYSDVRYQNIFSMGPTYRMMADGTALTGGPGGANFYGVAYTHSNMGGQSKAGLGHQALFVTNGSTQTAIGTGIWTSGNVNIGGGLSDRRLDVYNSANNGDGLAIGQDTDNSQTIQAYIDNQWTNRVSYASGCCNLLKLQPDVGAVQIGSATNPTSALSVFGAATFSSTINATGAITASQFNGSGAGLTGTAASLTAGAVPWSGITSKPAYLFYYQGFTLDANTMASNVSGFTYSNNAPHTGPIASFSEPGYPLQLNASYGGGGDAFSFRTRNGDNGTWNGWNTILHSDNYNSYSPTLTGGGASGTWGINITGNAATATYSSSTNDIFVNTSGDTMTGALTTPSLSFTGVGGNSGQPAAGSDYRIYQEPGTWSYPYPDLNIAYHTGIKIGAHSSYGGTRFFNNSDMVTELMSVGNGDNHVRISNQLLVTGNVGIGSATANGTLQLHSTSASTDRRIMFTDGTTGSAASDGLVLVKATDQNGYLWNYENNSLIFGTNNTERINIAAGGTIDLKSDTKTRNLNVGVWSGSSNGFPNADSRFNIGSSTQWYTYSYVYRAYSKNGLIQGFDLAEGMPYEGDLEAGDIVVAHATKKETVIGSSKSYQETVMGVVSTAPGITLGTNWSADSIAKYGDIPMKPIALAGRVPVKVTLEGGTITQNDKITSSSTAKFGMKSTKVGNVVAVAMESFAPNTSICSAVPSVSAIVWPADEDGHNSAKPCFYTPDGKYYGKIMAIINVSWYDPDAYLSSTDGTVITGQSQNYAVTPVGSNSPITRISLLAEAVIGKIKAGLVTTQDLVVTNTASISSLTVNSLQVGGSSLQAYIESVVNNMQLNNSTSLPPGSVVTDNITATGSATINKTVTNTLNVTSTATIAGSLKAQTIETNDLKANTSKLGNLLSDTATFGTATISGSTSGNEPILDVRGSARITALEAKMANVENIRALTATLYDATVSGTLYANTIAGLDEKVAAGLQPTLLQQLIGYDPAATDSARIISQITGVDLSTTIVLDPAALDSLPTDKVLLGANAAFLEQYLQVNGNTALGGDLMIVGSINMTNGLSLHDNSISYTPVLPASCELDHSSPQCSTTLRIQPSGAGALDLMNGLALLENGTVTITGDVTFTKKVIVRDTLLADLLAPTSFDKPIQIKVAGVATESGELVQSRFEIINELDSPVATISAQGKADFSGGISVGRTDLLTPDASGSATVTKTSGKAAIPVGSSQIRILSDRITPDTLIYVTAQGDTQNQNLYIKNQIVGEAVIGFNNPLPTELVFNWWIVE
ncbi:hypothetical protein KA012_02495 [Candidatus Woesebacteria bacterium]|nr:hypothetical protein [Candidatus Woesebacteria bacterium]